MSRTASESDGSNSLIRRLSRTVSSGSAVRVGVGSPPVQAQRDKRLRTVADPDDEYGRWGSNDADELNRARWSKQKQGQEYVSAATLASIWSHVFFVFVFFKSVFRLSELNG